VKGPWKGKKGSKVAVEKNRKHPAISEVLQLVTVLSKKCKIVKLL
jgi:hypothetical protein